MFKLVGPVTTHLPAKIFFRLHIHPPCPAKNSPTNFFFSRSATVHLHPTLIIDTHGVYIVTINGRFEVWPRQFTFELLEGGELIGTVDDRVPSGIYRGGKRSRVDVRVIIDRVN